MYDGNMRNTAQVYVGGTSITVAHGNSPFSFKYGHENCPTSVIIHPPCTVCQPQIPIFYLFLPKVTQKRHRRPRPHGTKGRLCRKMRGILLLELRTVQLCVKAAAREQLFMVARLHDVAVPHN